MKFKKFSSTYNKLIQEKKNESYSRGCAMVYVEFPEIEGIQSMISKDDIYTESGDRSYGLEDEPHVTLLYGFDLSVKPNEVFNILDDFNIDEVKLTKVTAFKNEKFDVLKFDVSSDILFDINKKLSELPHETDFPDYHPHLTIAYLKPGTADKYIKKMKGLSFNIIPSQYVYSLASGNKHIREI